MADKKGADKSAAVAHITCPKCESRVYLTAMWDSEKPDKDNPYADIKALVDDDPKFWGGPNAKRVIVKSCYSHKDPRIHFRVDGQDRLAYLKGRAPARRKKRKKKPRS